MKCYVAPNRKDSILHTTLKGHLGDIMADKHFEYVRSPQFMEMFGNWDAISYVQDEISELETEYQRSIDSHLSHVVDQNGEPIPLFIKEIKPSYTVLTTQPINENPVYLFSKNIKEIGSYNDNVIKSLIGKRVTTIKSENDYIVTDSSSIITPPFNQEGPISLSELTKTLDVLSKNMGFPYELDYTSPYSGTIRNNTVVINPAKANTRTAFHEFAHIPVYAIKKYNKGLYNSLLREAQSIPRYNEILESIKDILEYQNNAQEEALVRLISEMGTQEQPVSRKPFWDKVKQMFREFAKYVKNLLGVATDITNLSPDTSLASFITIIFNDRIKTVDDIQEQYYETDNQLTALDRAQSVENAARGIVFVDDRIEISPGRFDIDPYTNVFKKTHYYEKSGKRVDISITEFIQDKEYFDHKIYIDRYYRKDNKTLQELTEENKIFFNDAIYEFLDNPVDHTGYKSTWEAYKKYIETNYRQQMIDEGLDVDKDRLLEDSFSFLYNLFRKWARHRESASTVHEIIEAVMTEQDIISTKPRIKGMYDRIEQIKNKNSAQREKAEIAILDIVEKIEQLKEYIKSKGGVIVTEPILYSDRVIDQSGTIVNMAGRADVLAVYPDGTGQIFDLKTMVNSPEENGELSNFYNVFKQRKHAMQLVTHKRLIETNSKIKIDEITGVFVIPIHVKSTYDFRETLTTKPAPGKSSHLPEEVYIPKFNNDRIIDQSLIDAGIDFVVNLKSFGEIYDQSESRINRRVNFDHIHTPTQEEIEVKQKTIDEQYRLSNFDKKLADTLDSIRVYIFKAKSKKGVSKSELSKLESNLQMLNRITALFDYVHYANKVINDGLTVMDQSGNTEFLEPLQERVESIRSNFESGLYNKYDPAENLKLAIKDIDNIRRDIREFSVLDDIIGVLSDAPTTEKKEIEQNLAFKKLQELVNTKARLLRMLDDLGMRLISKSLLEYRMDSLNRELEGYFNKGAARKQAQLDSLMASVAAGTITQEQAQSQIDSLSAQIKQLYDNINKYSITEQSIYDELMTLDQDVPSILKHVMSATTVNNKILGLATSMLQTALFESDRIVAREQIFLQKLYDKIVPRLAKLNPQKYGLNNLTNIMKELIEEKETYVENPNTGKLEKKNVLTILAPYNLDYLNKLQTLRKQVESMLSSEPVILDDDLNPVLDENGNPKVPTFSQIRKKREELRNWMHDNMQKQYVDDYYKHRELLLQDQPGDSDLRKEARTELTKQLDDISEQISQILDTPDTENISVARRRLFTNEEKLKLKELYIRRRAIASNYHPDGTAKLGLDLEVAHLYDEYRELFNSVHDFHIDEEDYYNSHKIVTDNLKKEYPDVISLETEDGEELIPEWKLRIRLWEDEHNDVVTTDAFNNKVKRYFTHSKALRFIDSLLSDKKLGISKVVTTDFRNKLLDVFIEENDLEVIQAVDDLIATYKDIPGLPEMWAAQSTSQELLNNIIRPYYTNGGYDVTMIKDNEELVSIIKDAEQKNDRYIFGDKSLKEQHTEVMTKLFGVNGYGGLAANIEIPEYWEEYIKAAQLIGSVENGQYINSIKDTKWYRDNHIELTFGKKTITKPLKIWTRILPSGLKDRIKKGKVLSEVYNDERAIELNKIRQYYKEKTFSDFDITKEKDYDDAVNNLKSDQTIYDTDWFNNLIQEKLKDTEWFRTAHVHHDGKPVTDNNGNYIPSPKYTNPISYSNYKNLPTAISNYFKVQPSRLFRKTQPKKEYLKTPEELEKIYDIKGRLKPIESKWKNPKYDALMQREDEEGKLLRELYNEFTKTFFADQENITNKNLRLGYVIPPERKRTLDMMYDDKGSFSIKGMKQAIKEEFKTGFVTTSEDVEDVLSERSSTSDDLDFKPLRTLIPLYTDPSEVELNLFRTLLMHKAKASRYKAKYDILPEVRTLMSVLKNRDLDPNRGKLEKDVRGRSVANRIYRLATGRSISDEDLKLLSTPGETWQYKMLNDFFEMQLFGEKNIPVEWNKWTGDFFNKFNNNKYLNRIHSKVSNKTVTFRIDKMADSIRGLASLTQVGGFYSFNSVISLPAFMKGMANWTNAQHQIFMEAWADKHFDSDDLKYAIAHFAMPKKGQSIFSDKLADIGRLAALSKTGQLENMFSPIQGDLFYDVIGRAITGSNAGMVFKTMLSKNILFFFQHSGEWQAGMTLLYTMLRSYRVDKNGNVHNKESYIAAKKQELGRDITPEERKQFTIEFKNIDRSLIDVLNINKEGVLEFDEGIKFGDRLDIINSDRFKELEKKSKEGGFTTEEEAEYKRLLEEVKEGKKAINQFTTKLHELSRDMFGNYNKFSTPAAKRHFAMRLLFQYKDYFVPMFYKRFGKFGINYHLGTPIYGFHRHFFKLLLTDFKNTMKEIKYAMMDIFRKYPTHNEALDSLEYQNIRRALYEQLVVIGLVSTLALVAPGDDDDLKDISLARWVSLYQLAKMRQEIGSMVPSIIYPSSIINENWKLLTSPFALYRFGLRVIDLTESILVDEPWSLITTGDLTRYDKGYGRSIDKGDSKLLVKFRRIFGTMGESDPQMMYQYLNRNN